MYLRSRLSAEHIRERLCEDVAGIESDVVRRKYISVVDGGRTIDAMCHPLLQVLANLLVVVVGGRAVIFKSGVAAPVLVGGSGEVDKSCLDSAYQPEALQRLVAVRGVGLRERGGDDMQPDYQIAVYGIAPELAPVGGDGL